MNETASQLLETALKRPLTAAEVARWEACCAAHPSERAGWETDLALNELLRELPPAPVPSNFTAQVLGALDREPAVPATNPVSDWLRRWGAVGWLRPVAFAALLLVLGGGTWQQHRQHQRTEVARSLQLPSLMRLPTVDLLQDFDAIHSLSQSARGGADVDLLAALEREK